MRLMNDDSPAKYYCVVAHVVVPHRTCMCSTLSDHIPYPQQTLFINTNTSLTHSSHSQTHDSHPYLHFSLTLRVPDHHHHLIICLSRWPGTEIDILPIVMSHTGTLHTSTITIVMWRLAFCELTAYTYMFSFACCCSHAKWKCKWRER
jgi:hypothetical protein